MNVFDLLSNEKDNEKEEDKILLKKAKMWLKEAGFPQYIQMYNDNINISLTDVKGDHVDFDGEALMALFRRIEILNQSIEAQRKPKIERTKIIPSQPKVHKFEIIDDEDSLDDSKEPENKEDNQNNVKEATEKLMNEESIIENVHFQKSDDEEDDDDDDESSDDDKENEHIALSKKWVYEPHTRRWSHVEPESPKLKSKEQPDSNQNKLQTYLGTLFPKPYPGKEKSNNNNNHQRSTSFKVIRAMSRLSPNQLSFKVSHNRQKQDKNEDIQKIDNSTNVSELEVNSQSINTSSQRPISVNGTIIEESERLNKSISNTSLDPVLDLLESDLKSLDVFRSKINSKSSPDSHPQSPRDQTTRPQSLFVSTQKNKSSVSNISSNNKLPFSKSEAEFQTNPDLYLSKSYSGNKYDRKSATLDIKSQFNRAHPSRWSHSVLTKTSRSIQPVPSQFYLLSHLNVNQLNVLKKRTYVEYSASIEKNSSPKNSLFNWKLLRIRKKDKSINGLPSLDNLHQSQSSPHHSPTSSSPPITINQPPVFGVNLSSHQTRFGCTYPPAIQNIYKYLYKHAPINQGVFRKTGMKVRINQLKQQIDIDPYLNDFTDYTVHDIADVLKSFFRDLPIRMFDLEISNIIISLYTCVQKSDQISRLSYVIYQLSDINRIALQKLLQFLEFISKYSEETKMDVKNLSLCLSPSLFTFQSDTASYSSSSTSGVKIKKSHVSAGGGPNAKFLAEQNTSHVCLVDLINNWETLFKVKENTMDFIRSIPGFKWDPINIDQIQESITWQNWVYDKIRLICQDAGALTPTWSTTAPGNSNHYQSPFSQMNDESTTSGANKNLSPSSSNHLSQSASSLNSSNHNMNNSSWKQISKEFLKRIIGHVRWQLPRNCNYKYQSPVDMMIPNKLSLSYQEPEFHGDNINLRTWRATIEIEAKPGYVFNVIKEHRSKWDPFIEEVGVIDQINEYSELLQYSLFDFDESSQSRIAYVLQSHQLGLGGTGNLLVTQSIDSTSHHIDLENEILCQIFRDDFYIESTVESSCRVTWVSRIDVHGFRSDWYNNYWCARMLAGLCALRRAVLWAPLTQQQPQTSTTSQHHITQHDFQNAPETDL